MDALRTLFEGINGQTLLRFVRMSVALRDLDAVMAEKVPDRDDVHPIRYKS